MVLVCGCKKKFGAKGRTHVVPLAGYCCQYAVSNLLFAFSLLLP